MKLHPPFSQTLEKLSKYFLGGEKLAEAFLMWPLNQDDIPLDTICWLLTNVGGATRATINYTATNSVSTAAP